MLIKEWVVTAMPMIVNCEKEVEKGTFRVSPKQQEFHSTHQDLDIKLSPRASTDMQSNIGLAHYTKAKPAESPITKTPRP